MPYCLVKSRHFCYTGKQTLYKSEAEMMHILRKCNMAGMIVPVG